MLFALADSPLRSWSFWEKPLQGAIQWLAVGILGWAFLRAKGRLPKLWQKTRPHMSKIVWLRGEIAFGAFIMIAAWGVTHGGRIWSAVNWIMMLLVSLLHVYTHWLTAMTRRVARTLSVLGVDRDLHRLHAVSSARS